MLYNELGAVIKFLKINFLYTLTQIEPFKGFWDFLCTITKDIKRTFKVFN